MLVPGNVKATQDILLRSYNYCRNRDDGCCCYLMQERDESGTEYKCAYYGNHRCKTGMLDDAIELLKEQEAVKPLRERSGGGTTWWNVCGNCRTAINPNDKFCHECGKAVNW